MLFSGIKIKKQFKYRIMYFIRTAIRLVHFIDDHDGLEHAPDTVEPSASKVERHVDGHRGAIQEPHVDQSPCVRRREHNAGKQQIE